MLLIFLEGREVWDELSRLMPLNKGTALEVVHGFTDRPYFAYHLPYALSAAEIKSPAIPADVLGEERALWQKVSYERRWVRLAWAEKINTLFVDGDYGVQYHGSRRG